ncbi:hypothetical protein [Hyalangium minutum]|uniref:Putative lipoprotein n=1 Tax=Hyalangium minutum TaxID=394096 RepID=A0A085WN79_9BACT|nr:hypothetical protein [Hyalangium minutum]KFE69142.1 putative lipoprotein [Hyalangium minutum]
MHLRRLVLASSPVLALVAVACFSDPVYPGDQVLGTFRFDATIDRNRTTCTGQPGEPVNLGDGGFIRFEGTYSRELDGGKGFFTVQGFSRSAQYEGQRVVSTHEVAAAFQNCGSGCSGSKVAETLDTVLLSNSQDELVGRRCSGLQADGGVPEDGGAQPPGPTPNGYDAQRACGTLTDDFIPGTSNCTCTKPCKAVYTVEGIKVN